MGNLTIPIIIVIVGYIYRDRWFPFVKPYLESLQKRFKPSPKEEGESLPPEEAEDTTPSPEDVVPAPLSFNKASFDSYLEYLNKIDDPTVAALREQTRVLITPYLDQEGK